MTSKITKIAIILVLTGIGALSIYSVNSINPVGSRGILLFDLLISVFLTMFFERITNRLDFANSSN
jgi:hypothetical protein